MRLASFRLVRWLASLQLGVALLVILAAVLAAATLVEGRYGREYTQWHAYHSSWFICLLGLIGVNVFASMAVRFPWNRGQTGFLLTHTGILVLMVGSIYTYLSGTEGQVAIAEGDLTSDISMTDQCQFTVERRTGHGGFHGADSRIAFTFRPGPSDWPEGKTLYLGQLGGVSIKVLSFYRHARVEEQWLADPQGPGPAIQFALSGSEGRPVQEQWLAAEALRSEASIGPVGFVLELAPVDGMSEDYLRPPQQIEDKAGLLSMHYEGKMLRIPITKNLGKPVAHGKSGVTVEIAEYLPNARPGIKAGDFETLGDKPSNPLLKLKVRVPGKDTAIRQIAFAKQPLLSLDGVHGLDCPVKFWYHHPAVPPRPGVGFFQTPDGKLYGRSVVDGKYRAEGPLKKGARLDAGAGFQVELLEHLPRARREVNFYPLPPAGGRTTAEAAMRVEVSVGGTTREFWMRRNDAERDTQSIFADNQLVQVKLENVQEPLGFGLRLKSFHRGLNPGRMGDASFASVVQLVDPARGIDEEHEISMNQPLSHGKFTFYQSSYEELPGGRNVSVLSVAYDPGQAAKYAGSLLICVGIAITFALRLRSRDNAWLRLWTRPESTR